MDRSRTIRPVLAGPVGRVVQVPADLVLAVLVVPGVVMDPVVPAARVDPAGRTDLVVPGARVGLAPVVPVGRVDLVSPGARERVRTDLVVPAGRADLEDLEDLEDQGVRVGLDGTGLGLAGPVAPRRLRTCSTAITTGVTRSGVALATRRTASARRTTVRRPRRPRTDSGGTVDLPREGPHPTGTARHLRAAGTDRRPLGAGILDGLGRRAT